MIFVHWAGRTATWVRKDSDGTITIKRWHTGKDVWKFTVACHGGGSPAWTTRERNGNYEASSLMTKGLR